MAAATMSQNPNTFFRILVAGHVFDVDAIKSREESFLSVLAQAKSRYGNALCLCRAQPRNLQIKNVRGKHHLALWPGDGPQHDTSCVFFRDDSEVAPAPPRQAATGQELAGNRSHAFNFVLDRDPQLGRHGQRTGGLVKPDAPREPVSSLQVILNTLWDEADLTRWHPKWQRDWGRTRYQILEASKSLMMNNVPLASRLFVPRRFREDERHALNAEFDNFKKLLERRPESATRSAVIIAPVRKMDTLPNGIITLYLRHLREGISIPAPVADYIGNNCRAAYRRAWIVAPQMAALADVERRKAEGTQRNDGLRPSRTYPEVMSIVHVELSEKGWLWARAAWMMMVHPGSSIPASSPLEVKLVDTLIERGYQFQRQLSADTPTNRKIPDWILRHVYDPNGKGVPRAHLQILSNGAEQKLLAARALLADSMASKGMPTWTWVPRSSADEAEVPPLPPLDTEPQEAAEVMIRQLHASNNLQYAYGSGLQSQNHHPRSPS